MVLKVEKTSNYTVIDNSIFKNKDLTLKGKGLLCVMLSLPDGWDYTLAGLATLSADGIDATRNALKELEAGGYFKRIQKTVGGKFADVEYVIYENPSLEKPLSGFPISGNPTQLSTNVSNTKELKKENIYSEIQEKYNNICKSMPCCVKMTDKRRRHIKARLSEHDMETITMAMRKMEESDFLSGRSGKWQANIDWLFANDTNIVKVIEGRYDNKHGGDSVHDKLKKAFSEVGNERVKY